MYMLTYLSALDREIRSSTHAPLFTAARLRHPALAAHETLASAMDVLADRSRDRNGDKDAITRALVAEYRESRERFWLSALLVAYAPMARRLCRRIRDSIQDVDECEQRVVTALIEAIDACPLSRVWFCRELRRHTERTVFAYLTAEQTDRSAIIAMTSDELMRHEVAAAARLCGPDMFGPAAHPPAVPADKQYTGADVEKRKAALAYLQKHAGYELCAEKLTLIITTKLEGQRLTRYVARRYPHLSEDLSKRTYERIKRRHSRAMGKLRNALAGRWQSVRSARAAEDDQGWLPLTICPLQEYRSWLTENRVD